MNPVVLVRKIRQCESEVAAQLVLESLLNQARADALREAADWFVHTDDLFVVDELRRMADAVSK